ncbi:hypothetical protein H0Z09_15945 [Pseudomonas sp. SWRI18]|uniref:dermonecrotic toxin domain-containing protein n=1 Tax=Pseudomonas sp. SWRI18 TaxID=2753888 RepID=UPI0016442629|nr:DUF6543 domain-containing protein [Pseudomonas sp. SWRI18]MBC3302619.1 hypothetical protein [Pseudomonas sp. SWRI18]
MARLTPPYFFDEFLRPVRRKQPTERERELGLSLRDLDWLHTLYYASDKARQDPELRSAPMVVEKLTIHINGKAPMPLAGVFMMSPAPDEAKAVLYTPYGGLEVFDSRASALIDIRKRMMNTSELIDLSEFIPIIQRRELEALTDLTLTPHLIQGAVMQDQEASLIACRQHNLQAMLDQLRKTPTLPWMLDRALAIMGRAHFPGLDHRDSRVNSFVPTHDGREPQWVSSVPLTQALLQFYLMQGWPTGQIRRFDNPRQVTSGMSDAQRIEDTERWQSLVESSAQVLSKLLSSLLHTYWNEDFDSGQSRQGFFAQVLSDTLRIDLLLKRQSGIVSAEESQRLLGVFLPDQASRRAHYAPLRIETVHIEAPYRRSMELAGTLMFSSVQAYLYTHTRGLQVLKDLDDLNDTLLSMLKAPGHEDELLNFLSLDERSVFVEENDLKIKSMPIKHNVFGEMIETVVAKQLSNLEFALDVFRRSDAKVDLAALLDCVLDVRQMLDQRLLALDAGGRWSLNPVTRGYGLPSTVQAERAKLQLPTLLAAATAVRALHDKHPTLRQLAMHALNVELEKSQLSQQANEVYINTYASAAQQSEERAPERSLSMVEHFIECLAGVGRPVPDSPRTGFYSERRAGAALRWNNLGSRLFNAVIDRARVPFFNHDVRTLPRLFLQQHQAQLSEALMLGLRGEADLRLLNKSLPRSAHEVLDTVLRHDSLTRLKRHGLNGFLPDAFSLTVTSDGGDTLYPLANCFVLTERGGIDPALSGLAVVWTPRLGYEAFASIQAVCRRLEQRLAQPDERWSLLENLAITRRLAHQNYRLGPLQRIDEHLLNNRRESWHDFALDHIDYLLRIPLAPRPMQDCLDNAMQQPLPTNLNQAVAIALGMVHQQDLPVWLGMASPEEQRLQAQLLEQYRVSTLDARDYLHSLPTLREHVALALKTLLDKRFPTLAIDPHNILIPGRPALNGHNLSLIDFALGHLPDLQGDNIRPHSRTATALPAALDGAAVVQLVRQLDLAAGYGALLKTHLDGNNEDSLQRRALFCRQLPWQLLRHAHQEKLEERISAKAWSLVMQVFDMPDAVARAALGGATAMIRPLELIATPGAVPAKPLGVYLIGPQAAANGPLVLYAPYSPLPVLREYAREEDLLDEINRPGPLQDWLIRQLDGAHQATYRHLLDPREPSKGTDIRLTSTPVAGNVLSLLFEDNTRCLIKMLACQFDPGGKTEWEAVTRLLRKGIPIALQFIAGKLTYPWVVWRSFQLFKASAEDLQQQHWGPALKHFILGVAKLAALREPLDAAPATATPSETASTGLDEPVPVATTLATLDVTAALRTRLQHFEERSVALADLAQSVQTHVYRAPGTSNGYVPVAGKVYPVRRAGERWCIAKDDEVGPFVQRDSSGKWVLDLSRHNPRFGKTLSRYAGLRYTRSAEHDAIHIEAVGLGQITALSGWKAQCINEALNVATYYAVNCKRNIQFFAKDRLLGSRLGLFFTELFGVVSLSPAQLARVEQRVDEVLNELVNPSLCSPDSARFVSGTSRWSPIDTYAFVLPDDIDKKIYLLDRFFDPRLDVYQNRLNAPFSISAHARATVLIHELTHLMGNTEDIAYLDSMRPFNDLINLTTERGRELHTDLVDLRSLALSTLTPANLLFKAWDTLSARWENLGRDPTTAHARDKILKMTGAKTLHDARQIFMSNADKRIDTILANADSVTYLIAEVGRQLDPGA